MIKKTHSVKSLSATRDSKGVQALERSTMKMNGGKRRGADMETTNLHEKDLKSTLKQLLLTFMVGNCHDGDSQSSHTVL